jgi:hypothetical protein
LGDITDLRSAPEISVYFFEKRVKLCKTVWNDVFIEKFKKIRKENLGTDNGKYKILIEKYIKNCICQMLFNNTNKNTLE